MSALEKHYSVHELAEIWQLSDETIRRLFRDEPGVLKLTAPRRRKRSYEVIRIPESVAIKKHEALRRTR